MVHVTRIYICCLLVSLPLKFGNVIPNMEQSFFPLTIWEWMLTPWAPFMFPVLIAPVLMATAFSARHQRLTKEQWLLVAGFGGLLLAALVGLIRTTEWDYAQLFIWHILGMLGLVLGALLQNAVDPAFRKWALVCVAAGVVCAAITGWTENYGDINERTIDYLRQQAPAAADPEFLADMERRLESGRARGPFANPNSFAAHLILTIPLAVALFWGLGKSFAPARVSCPALAAAAGILTGWALVMTRSRAGLAAAAGGVALTVLVAGVKERRHVRKALALCALVTLVAVGGLLAVNQGRTFSSLGKRGGYLQAGIEMFFEAPITGVGVGEYFPWYMRLKAGSSTGKGDDEVTRVPHNVATLFFSQCGIVGVLAVVFWGGCCVIVPARLIRRRKRSDWLDVALFAGAVAWLGHALLDFNFQIAGTAGTFAVLVALLAVGEKDSVSLPDTSASPLHLWRQLAVTALAVICFAGIWRWPGEKAYQEFYQAMEAGEPWETCRPLGETARRKLPFSPYPDMVMGRLCVEENRLPESIHHIEQALERAPHRGSLWHVLARLKHATGDRQGAREAYLKARIWDRGPHGGKP
ncbi:MAG: O-antigen ligase family protein [Lentisphaeria bacterium]|nr:O-antigen ligase family protein [Lentisphaeria bacterium]